MHRLRGLKPEIALVIIVFAVVWAFGAYQAVVSPPAPVDERNDEVDLSGRSNVVVLRQAHYDFIRDTSNPRLETGWCLHGRRARDDVYRVDEITMAEMFERSSGHIRMSCDDTDDMLGHVHSHPISNIPYPSRQDVRSYFESQEFPDRYIEGIFTAGDHELRFYRQIGDRRALSLMEIVILDNGAD